MIQINYFDPEIPDWQIGQRSRQSADVGGPNGKKSSVDPR